MSGNINPRPHKWKAVEQCNVLRESFQKLMQPYVDAKVFMGSVLVATKGKTIFSNGYGMANLEWSIPNSPTTRFNIASMTKQFTAAAILLLEDRGKLKTSDLVKKYLPAARPLPGTKSLFIIC